MAVWSRHAAAQLLEWLEGDFSDAVVWARGTPPESFEAAIVAFRRKPFPLIVNYNDPMPFCLLGGLTHSKESYALDELQHRQNRFLAEHAQAWTFPSRRLADLMADAAGLDRKRCFVVPHIVPNKRSADPHPLPDGSWIMYAGTFYPRLFTEHIKSGIAKYAQGHGKLRFLFVLKRPKPDILEWIKREVPGAQIYCDLHPSAVVDLMQRAQALMIVNSSIHEPLLPSKVVQAVCSQKPILAFITPPSTTGDVVSAAGAVVIDPVSAEQVANGFCHMEEVIAAGQGQEANSPARQQISARFSASRITEDIVAILSYASDRFRWSQYQSGPEPEPPTIERWP